MPERPPIARRGHAHILWMALAGALVAHAIIIASLQGVDLSTDHPVRAVTVGLGGDAATETLAEGVPDPELKKTCAGDIYLATVGRAALCVAPWRGDADLAQCQYDTMIQLYMDLSSCHAAKDPGVAVAMISPKQAEQLKAIDPEKLIEEMEKKKQDALVPPPPIPQIANQPPPPPPPPPAPKRPMQIVETAKPEDEKEPDNARLLAEYNTKVDKQKVARGAADEKMVAKSKPKELDKSPKPPDEDPSVKQPTEMPPGKNDKAPPVPNTLAMRKPGRTAPPSTEHQDEQVRGSSGGSKAPQVADGYMQRRGTGSVEQEHREREEQPRGDNGGGGGAPPVPNLKPTKEQLERALGGGNVDHIEDADEGDETALNAKRFVFASFFNRMKRQVAQNWNPASTWNRVDPNGTVYGFKTRITEVRVSLAPGGAMTKIVVTSASGVSELDDEAVRAFRAAAPFPNPPEGLVKDGQIQFAFSFYFEIGQPRSAWRMVRTN